jgi:hypothetical protein
MDLNEEGKNSGYPDNYSNNVDVDIDEQMLENLARMESRITVLEDKLEEIMASTDKTKNKQLLQSSVIIDGNEYVCMKYLKKEVCILQKKIRNIGFDICIDDNSICPWAFKINDV